NADALRGHQHRETGRWRHGLWRCGDGDPAQARSRSRRLEPEPQRFGPQSQITCYRGHRNAGLAPPPDDPDRAPAQIRREPDRRPGAVTDVSCCVVAERAGFAIHRRRLLPEKRRYDRSDGALNTRRGTARRYGSPGSQRVHPRNLLVAEGFRKARAKASPRMAVATARSLSPTI